MARQICLQSKRSPVAGGWDKKETRIDHTNLDLPRLLIVRNAELPPASRKNLAAVNCVCNASLQCLWFDCKNKTRSLNARPCTVLTQTSSRQEAGGAAHGCVMLCSGAFEASLRKQLSHPHQHVA